MKSCPSCGRENPDDARFCMACATALADAGVTRDVRKIVTVIFCDVSGSTALGERLDPESLRHVMGRYFDAMRAVIERHGGLVEKFIGDAVMAAFGVPVLHEDDAVRAVRAASEMREALGALNQELERERGVSIRTRIGVNTGEVLVGDPSPERGRVTGDAVNTAARLEQAAAPGEILIGEDTYRLVREEVVVEPGDHLSLKGKSDLIFTHRLIAVRPVADALRRRLDVALVGRERQLSLLRQSFEACRDDRSSHLFTMLGSAGVGKSRLAEEFLEGLDQDVTVLRGRCLPYGEGITFWPVVETVRAAAAISDGDAPEVAREKIAQLVLDEQHADRIADGVGTAMGISGLATTPDEILWSIRRLFESIARRSALLLAFDDIHWGEPTFLDLVEHIATWNRDAPIFLLCLARQELLDQRPSWGGGTLNTTTIHLEPLSAEESGELVELLLGRAEIDGPVKRRIAEAADGNPLYVEEMVSMLIDEGALTLQGNRWRSSSDLSTVPVPPTIQALLSARLDQLGDRERSVAERAAIEGRVFHRAAIVALGDEAAEKSVDASLVELMRRELIRPDRSQFGGDDAFRFRHVLIRDAAYHAIPKETRARLHARFAAWLQDAAGARIQEYEEILGYHLEQAYRYRGSLGPVTDADQELAERAASLLADAGRRAIARIDLVGAIGLLARAVALEPLVGRRRVELLTDMGATLNRMGDYEPAERALMEAVEGGVVLGDDWLEARARLDLWWTRTTFRMGIGFLDEMPREVERLVPVLEAHDDDLGLTKAWQLLAERAAISGRFGEMLPPLERALVYARRAGDRLEEAEVMWSLMISYAFGPSTVVEGIERCDAILDEIRGDQRVEASVLATRATLRSMLGHFEEARETILQGREIVQDLGLRYYLYNVALGMGDIALLAGDPVEAERAYRTAFDADDSIRMDLTWNPLTAKLAKAVCAQGRFEEALEIVELASKDPGDSVVTAIILRSAKAKALAGLGQRDAAEALTREALEIASRTDAVDLQGDTDMDAADVFLEVGNRDEAVAAVRAAIASYEQKGNIVSAERARTRLDQLEASG